MNEVDEIMNNITFVLRRLFYFKAVVTILIIIWLIFASIMIATPVNNNNNYNYNKNNENAWDKFKNFIVVDDKNYTRYFNLHRVWFGDQSIVELLIKTWYSAIALWIGRPVIRYLINKLK